MRGILRSTKYKIVDGKKNKKRKLSVKWMRGGSVGFEQQRMTEHFLQMIQRHKEKNFLLRAEEIQLTNQNSYSTEISNDKLSLI